MDFNNDGLIDLVAGDTEGNIWFFQNIGSAKQAKLAAGVKLQAGGKTITGTAAKYEKNAKGEYTFIPTPDAAMGVYSKLNVADWDGDGLLDILVGQDSAKSGGSEIVFYHNIGTAKEPKLAAPVPLDIPKTFSRPSPYVVDWDGDGKQDLLIGTDDGKIYFLKNIGTNQQPKLAAPSEIVLPGLETCYRCRFTVTDWNNDGKFDLVVGTFHSGKEGMGGNVWLFLRK